MRERFTAPNSPLVVRTLAVQNDTVVMGRAESAGRSQARKGTGRPRRRPRCDPARPTIAPISVAELSALGTAGRSDAVTGRRRLLGPAPASRELAATPPPIGPRVAMPMFPGQAVDGLGGEQPSANHGLLADGPPRSARGVQDRLTAGSRAPPPAPPGRSEAGEGMRVEAMRPDMGLSAR